ncbi:NADP-dependent oxidoreductase domain-containing protein [Limtongia smithiae]|uniref:NADP-dependent oxidoreductase domain-containing protein n=1 Tax=Limtongia smithiae TaxID=1125753 RepID=UPI0034CD8196
MCSQRVSDRPLRYLPELVVRPDKTATALHTFAITTPFRWLDLRSMCEITGIPVGPLGFGLMGFTWRPVVLPEEEAFKVMKEAIDLGANFINSGEFYANEDRTLNLKYVRRFFEKYPEYADKTVLSVKGGMNLTTFQPDSSPEGIRTSVENVISCLGDAKKLDIFEAARVDPKVPIETTMKALTELIAEGKVGGISLSEVGAATIRRAAAVAKISAVEIEYSMYSVEALSNGVLETCAELGIPVIAYSPLGRGFLTGQIKSRADLPPNDMRLHFDRFSEENFGLNIKLLHEVENLAKVKGVTPAQFALAWIKKHEEKIPGLTIIPIPGATKIERVQENFAKIDPLTDEEFKDIGDILQKIEVRGGRYNSHHEALLWA